MDNDDAFLRALADNPGDQAVRRAYAIWLEERRDPRAEFLRLQHAFTPSSADSSTYPDLCAREQEVVRQLDPTWIQRVRCYTTAAPCRDIGRLVPGLIPVARTAIRLHPRRLIGALPADMSKIGGHFLWPAAEPWPSCPQCDVPLAPVLQLRARDARGIVFPPGTDLFQLFWCPAEEAHGYELTPKAWWRTTAAVTRSRTDDPDLSSLRRAGVEGMVDGNVPCACSVFAEPVLEYPLGDDLHAVVGSERATQIQRQLEDMDLGSDEDLDERYTSVYGPADAQSLAFYELGQCPGTKVGGKPELIRDGRRFDHLVSLSTWEFDSASFRRWLPVEDQRLLAPPGAPLTWHRLFFECDFRPPIREPFARLRFRFGSFAGAVDLSEAADVLDAAEDDGAPGDHAAAAAHRGEGDQRDDHADRAYDAADAHVSLADLAQHLEFVLIVGAAPPLLCL